MNVTVLWLNRCSLMEVEGIAALPNLKELYLAFNEIEDISALSALEKLESLDLERYENNAYNTDPRSLTYISVLATQYQI